MKNKEILYCKNCSEPKLSSWKGWPIKISLPLLPRLVGQSCEICGGTESISNHEIKWLNFHGPHSTGLPDYWLLVVDRKNGWGDPYFDEGICQKCGGVKIISCFETNSGNVKMGSSCETCDTA
jgi:hypothetical protein